MSVVLRRFVFSSLMLWFLATLAGVYFLSNFKRFINFGIDLVGGIYITLEVQTDKMLEDELIERFNSSMKLLKADNKSVAVSQKIEGNKLIATFESALAAQTAESLPINREKKLLVVRDGAQLEYSFSEQEKKALIKDAVESNIVVLRSRVDQFGVGEVPIVAQGEKNIAIELPNVHDVARAKAIIGTSALLEVKPVLDVGSTEDEILQRHNNALPEGTMIVTGRERAGSEDKQYYLVPRHADLTGKMLKSARANPTGGEFGIEPVIDFVFNTEGGDRFFEMTSRGTNPLVAMIVDNIVITAARAAEPLRSGYIKGNFTLAQAQELASMLRSGAFVAPVTFEEDRTIGASLGAESVRRGLVACCVGLGLLLIFSLIVYKMAGLLAFVVLLYNLLLILFALAYFGATLTLPGIAGMVLSIGMAIDSSILIYERIREELLTGKSLRNAVNEGFSDATAVILDANVTHLLVAIVLYKLGAGPIQGFAITMIIGIVATLLTGLVLLKSIFNFIIDVLGVQRLTI